MKRFMAAGKAIGIVVVIAAVAACAPTRTTVQTAQAPQLITPMPSIETPVTAMPQPTATPPIQQARLNPGQYRFLDTAAMELLTPAARSAATDAQFYALQFGRPGAPRNWSSGGSTGQVSVGPYVRVNNLDCREFTHRTTVGGQTYTRSGTACREADGSWDVV